MSMPDLYKQNLRQWVAIWILALFFFIEYEFRMSLENKVERNYWELIRTERSLVETTPAKNDILPSCLVHAPVKPKHKNHQH